MNGRSNRGDREKLTSRRRVLCAGGTVAIGLLAGCLGDGDDGEDSAGENSGETSDDSAGDAGTEMEGSDGGTDGESDSGSGESWRTTELTNVLTDETFSIEALPGPVVVQSFAVWCPKCERQSETLANVDDSVTVVGLNTDPNEDAEQVRQHAESNGFDWRFAVAPTAMTESLIDEFGTTVTNAPSTPIIVACDDGTAEFFSGSRQSVEEIEAAAAEC